MEDRSRQFLAQYSPEVLKTGASVHANRGSNEWVLPTIYNYWDQRVDAVENLSRKIPLPSATDYGHILRAIRDGVFAHVNALADECLILTAWIVSEDLYKAANALKFLDRGLADYLEATAGTLFTLLRKRGYSVYYLADSTFGSSLLEMQRPLDIFPDWYSLIGFKYICPQAIAIQLMTHEKTPQSEFLTQLPRYIEEARLIADEVISRCHQNHDSFILLDTDVQEKTWVGRHHISAPGVINIYRCEAAILGSRSSVSFPTNSFIGMAT